MESFLWFPVFQYPSYKIGQNENKLLFKPMKHSIKTIKIKEANQSIEHI